jgi:hypothetical protein
VPPDRFAQPNGHLIPLCHDVIAAPNLAGLHHEYRLEPLAADRGGWFVLPALIVADHRRPVDVMSAGDGVGATNG